MTPERWQRVIAAVKATQGHPEDRRAFILAEACGNEKDLLQAAQSLLIAQQRMGSFLEEPARAGGLAITQELWSETAAAHDANCKVATPKAGAPPKVPEALPRGTMLGRYVVRDLLGTGGMGVVYAAYDPELGRKLAIKLLHSNAPKSLLGSDGRARLLREAQAMARLTHPNVIAVHDVGTFGGEGFIAMEYVDGCTLKRWLKSQPRTWREILGMFVQAGQGLSAAHSAGIVHRDFKPENVLVGRDGRVRVVDFGLARGTVVERAPDAELGSVERSTSIDPNSIADGMTLPGTVLGTPAYMSPEQLAGGKVDARTDQFSFCASLFHCLYGEYPFTGDTLQQRLAAIRKGKMTQPRTSNVPGWLRKVVLKGLSSDPADRYPSVDVLLRHLRRRPANVWRRMTAIAAIVLIVALAPLVSYEAQRTSSSHPTPAASNQSPHSALTSLTRFTTLNTSCAAR